VQLGTPLEKHIGELGEHHWRTHWEPREHFGEQTGNMMGTQELLKIILNPSCTPKGKKDEPSRLYVWWGVIGSMKILFLGHGCHYFLPQLKAFPVVIRL